MWSCVCERGDCVSKGTEEKEEEEAGRVLAVLIVINHLVAQYPLTLALFDLHRSKMLVLK